MYFLPKWGWFSLRAVLFIAILLLLLYSFQDRFIFYPQSLSKEKVESIRIKYPDLEEVIITVADGVALHGWLIPGEEPKPSPLLVYFGGNAEEVSTLIPNYIDLGDWSVLLMNYRGYGLSEGNPTEEALLRDALMIYDQMSERADMDTEKIVVMGRSLGTAVATHVSAERDVQGTILVSPFESLTQIAQSHFPYLLVTWLLKYSFDSAAMAPLIKNPLLAFIAAEDEIIDPEYSQAFVSTWGGSYEQYIIEGKGHNSIHQSAEYWDHIQHFLKEIQYKNDNRLN